MRIHFYHRFQIILRVQWPVTNYSHHITLNKPRNLCLTLFFQLYFLISGHENKLLFFANSLANGQLIVLTILSKCSHSIQQQQQQQQNQEQSIGFINKWNWLSLINMAKNSTQIEFVYFKRLLSLFSLMF